ncbi:MAG: NrfD/PsrC family molybdoenzyme membrane anchor subunit, partial [Endomicrobiia bacterium]
MNRKIKILLVILIVVVGWALCAYIYQLMYGLGVTDMNRSVFWGIYIVNFVFLIGVSAGGVAVASLSHLLGIEKYKPVGRIAEITAIISLVLAMISILFDLGRPERILNLIIYMQPISPLVWDFLVINIYLILCLLLLWSSVKNEPKLTRTLAYISIPVFILVHSITAWIFGLMKSQPGWYNALLAP